MLKASKPNKVGRKGWKFARQPAKEFQSGGLVQTGLLARGPLFQDPAYHLGQEAHGAEHRSSGEVLGQSMKKSAGQRRVTEPPNVRQKTHAIDMHVSGGNELKQSKPAVCSAEPALLYAAPGCLRDSMGVDDLIYHHRTRFDLCGEAFAAGDVFRPDTGRQSVDAVIGQVHNFIVSAESHNR